MCISGVLYEQMHISIVHISKQLRFFTRFFSFINNILNLLQFLSHWLLPIHPITLESFSFGQCLSFKEMIGKVCCQRISSQSCNGLHLVLIWKICHKRAFLRDTIINDVIIFRSITRISYVFAILYGPKERYCFDWCLFRLFQANVEPNTSSMTLG